MKFLEVEVPNADEYQIDDFLSNRINDEWEYLENIKLPVNELQICEVKKCDNRTWLKIKVL